MDDAELWKKEGWMKRSQEVREVRTGEKRGNSPILRANPGGQVSFPSYRGTWLGGRANMDYMCVRMTPGLPF